MNWTNNISMDINSTIADVNSSNKINFTISIMHSRDVKTASESFFKVKSVKISVILVSLEKDMT